MSLFLKRDLTDHWGRNTGILAQDKQPIKQMTDIQQHKANKAFPYNILNIIRSLELCLFALCFKGFKCSESERSWKCYTNSDIPSGYFALFNGKVLFNITLFRYCFVIQSFILAFAFFKRSSHAFVSPFAYNFKHC